MPGHPTKTPMTLKFSKRHTILSVNFVERFPRTTEPAQTTLKSPKLSSTSREEKSAKALYEILSILNLLLSSPN